MCCPVNDAIRTLKAEDGEIALAEMQAMGARMTTTREAIDWLALRKQRKREMALEDEGRFKGLDVRNQCADLPGA